MTDLVMTIDAGTNACKALVFDLRGQIVSKGICEYRTDTSMPGHAELDPVILVKAVKTSIKSALKEIDPKKVLGMCTSAQLGTIFIDSEGRPLSKLLTWMDRRATEEAEELKIHFDTYATYAYSGRRIDPELAACKLLWLKNCSPQDYENIDKILSIKDYINFLFTGRCATDPIHASYSLMFNVESMKWHEAFFHTMGIPLDIVPDILPAPEIVGQVTASFARDVGLPKRIPVINGGSDGSIAALGAGLIDSGSAVNVVGTTDVILACSRHAVFDTQMRTLVNGYAVPDRWTLGGPMSTTGGCLKWFVDRFERPVDASDTTLYDRLVRDAEDAGIGAQNLIVIPSLVGERTPFWNPNVRGVIFGLTLEHDRKHIVRAILEGSAFAARRLMEILENIGVSIDQIYMVGGGAQGQLWARIRSNVIGKPVVIPNVSEATGLGCALLTYVGLGVFDSFEEAVEVCVDLNETITPDPSTQSEYNRRYHLYMRLHERLEESFVELADL